jgi:hypothetical protein
MAIFKLGAFITAIVGSVGGTNFKRGANNSIVTNKSFGGSNSKLKSNARLNPIANIFKAWSLLDDGVRSDWNDAALDYTFPNKFGDLVNLSGRQLFTKLNIQLLPVGSTVLDATIINNNINTISVDNFTLEMNPFNVELQMQCDGDDTWILVQLEISQNVLLAPIYNRRKITAYIFGEGAIGFDLSDEVFSQYPFINENYNVRAYVTVMNIYGFKGVPIFSDGTWII